MPSQSTGANPRGQRSHTILVFAVVAALLGLLAVLIGHLGQTSPSQSADWTTTDETPISQSPSAPPPSPSLSPTAKPSPVLAMKVKFPHSGPHTFTYAKVAGPVLGFAGPIRKFHLAIESNIKVATMTDVIAKVNATLGDSRSWVAGRKYRLQLVPKDTAAQFTIYLVTSATSSSMCAPLYTGGYTSCRQGSHVVLNLDRWMLSVPDYVKAKVPLETYRTYMINHEVGHALGNSHELCPGAGKPAPVMEQQTLGLHGCKANPWPYVNGKKYDGPLGRY